MTVDIGDILLWKDRPIFEEEERNPEHDEYFLVVAIDRGLREPYVCLRLGSNDYERFSGVTFGNRHFWEIVA